MCVIIGRKKETAELKRYLNSGRAELIAVYGRRRVGKTFLINEVFRDHMVFHHTGLSPYNKKRKVTLKDQLQNFYFSLLRHGAEGIAIPKSWMEAFFMLEQLLTTQDNGSRQVVFIDEMPWMDTPRSGFLTAFEGFWNGWAIHVTIFVLWYVVPQHHGCLTISLKTREDSMVVPPIP